MTKRIRATIIVLALSLAGCKGNPTEMQPAASPATVQYTITSPFCGPVTYTMYFSTDNAPVGTELLKDKGMSKVYEVPAGRHVIGAFVGNWSHAMDTTVTLSAGEHFVRDINLYCS